MKRLLSFCLAGLAVLLAGSAVPPVPAAVLEPSEIDAASMRQVIGTGNDLGLAIFGALVSADPTKTVVISPYSLAVALTMTAQGAAGETRAALAAHLAPEDMGIHAAALAHRAAASRLPTDGDRITLAIANAIWGSDRLPWQQSFVETLRTAFGADMRSVDFADPATVGRINRWVEAETRGMIPTLLDHLPESTGMVLTNAVYFRGLWQTPFVAEETRPAPFQLGGGGTRAVPMMRRFDRNFRYAETGMVQAVALPYGEGDIEMLVMVPRIGAAVPDLSPDLAADFGRLQFREQPGAVMLPRLELSFDTSLADVLGQMGLGAGFSAETADFSAMADVPPGVLVLDDVVHKTALRLDEEGTEAAAVTGVVVGVTSALEPIAPFTLIADRPFLFAIRDQSTGAILFLGHVADPGT